MEKIVKFNLEENAPISAQKICQIFGNVYKAGIPQNFSIMEEEGLIIQLLKPITDRHFLVQFNFQEEISVTCLLSILQIGTNAVVLYLPYDCEK